MDEISLFAELQPPPPPDGDRMREAARARLAAATNAPRAHPARRRGTVVAMAGAAALVAAGTGYGLTAVRGGSSPLPGTAPRDGSSSSTASKSGSSSLAATAAGLTAVDGCPGMYITAGTLERVKGTRAIIKPENDADHVNRVWYAKPVTVATTASTSITRPASGTVSDITDGSQVVVNGTWSGDKLVAAQVGIEAALPPPGSFGPKFPAKGLRRLHPPKGAPVGFPFASGTVTDVHDGGFTVVSDNPLGMTRQVRVITSDSTQVMTKISASLGQLDLGSNVVAVGRIGPDGVMTASTVAERSLIELAIAGGPVKIRTSDCSAASIETTAIQAGA